MNSWIWLAIIQMEVGEEKFRMEVNIVVATTEPVM